MPDTKASLHSTDLGDMRAVVEHLQSLQDEESIIVSSLQAKTSQSGTPFEVRYVPVENRGDEGEFRVFI